MLKSPDWMVAAEMEKERSQDELGSFSIINALI